jgi:hypothetical protein
VDSGQSSVANVSNPKKSTPAPLLTEKVIAEKVNH